MKGYLLTMEKSETILTPQQIQMAQEAEPHEVLIAIHKRVCDTEKLMINYRNHAKNLEVEIGMLKERLALANDMRDYVGNIWEKYVDMNTMRQLDQLRKQYTDESIIAYLKREDQGVGIRVVNLEDFRDLRKKVTVI